MGAPRSLFRMLLAAATLWASAGLANPLTSASFTDSFTDPADNLSNWSFRFQSTNGSAVYDGGVSTLEEVAGALRVGTTTTSGRDAYVGLDFPATNVFETAFDVSLPATLNLSLNSSVLLLEVTNGNGGALSLTIKQLAGGPALLLTRDGGAEQSIPLSGGAQTVRIVVSNDAQGARLQMGTLQANGAIPQLIGAVRLRFGLMNVPANLALTLDMPEFSLQPTVTVIPTTGSSPQNLVYDIFPRTMDAGECHPLQVRMTTDAGTTATPSGQVPVTFSTTSDGGFFSTASDCSASLPTYTETLQAGTSSSSVIYYSDIRTGQPTLTASAPNIANAAADKVDVGPGAFRRLLILGMPPSVEAGAITPVTVRQADIYGNSVGGTGLATISTPDDTLAGDINNIIITNGEGPANVQLFQAGTRTLRTQAADVINLPVVVTHGELSALQFDGLPQSAVQAGNPFGLTVRAVDPYGNPVRDFAGTVHFESNDQKNPTLPADYTFSPAMNQGTKTFPLGFTLRDATQSAMIKASVQGRPISRTTPNITVTPGPTTGFLLTGVNSTVASGVPSTLMVRPVDSFQNVVTSYTGTVALSAGGGATFSQSSLTFTSNNSPAGLSSQVTFGPVGTYTISASATQSALSGMLGPIQVTPGAFAGFSITAKSATTALACKWIATTVAARDQYGNQVPGARQVTVCATGGTTARVADSSLDGIPVTSSNDACITGDTQGNGAALIAFRATGPETAQLGLSNNYPQLGNSVVATWTASVFDPMSSKFVFENGVPESPAPTLRNDGTKLTVRFTPKDSCNTTVALQPGAPFNFHGTAPLVVTPTTKVGESYFADVTLASCPADPSAELTVEAMLRDASFTPARTLAIMPMCAEARATVLLSFPEGQPAPAAGYMVPATVRVKNGGDLPLTDGELRLTDVEGLQIAAVHINGAEQPATANGYQLPALAPGEEATLTVETHVLRKEAGTVRLVAWVHGEDGAVISEGAAAELKVSTHTVDVGGCTSTAGGFSLLWSLFAAAGILFGRRGRRG